MGVDPVEKRGAAEAAGGKKAPKERKKENRQTQTRDGEGGQGPHLHEQDFGRTIRGTGGALLLLTRVGTEGSYARPAPRRFFSPASPPNNAAGFFSTSAGVRPTIVALIVRGHPFSLKRAKRQSRHHPSRLSRSRHAFPCAASRRVSDGPAARYTATPRDAVLRRVEPPHGSESRLARLSPPGPSAASMGWIRR